MLQIIKINSLIKVETVLFGFAPCPRMIEARVPNDYLLVEVRDCRQL